MIKAIFFDIDGTLVSFNTHKVPQSTIDALDKLRAQGIKLFIASGRHKISINNLGNLPFDGYITVNGTICEISNKIIYKHSIPDEDIKSLIHYLENVRNFPCAFVYENGLLMNHIDKSVEEIFTLLNFPYPPISALKEMQGKDIFQVIAFFKNDEESEVMKHMPHCKTARWNSLFTDVISADSSKSVGISKVLEYLHIDKSEIMAFGDGGNDIEMLQYAGIGIAMGNANDEIKQIADYVTASVDDDGIEKALKHFGLI